MYHEPTAHVSKEQFSVHITAVAFRITGYPGALLSLPAPDRLQCAQPVLCEWSRMNESERDRPPCAVSCWVAHVLPLHWHCFCTASGVSVGGGRAETHSKVVHCCVKNVAPSLKAPQQVRLSGYIPTVHFGPFKQHEWLARWSASTGI